MAQNGRTAIQGVGMQYRGQQLIEMAVFLGPFPLDDDRLLQRPGDTDAVAFQISTNLEQSNVDS
jgi:hypothetical protein